MANKLSYEEIRNSVAQEHTGRTSYEDLRRQVKEERLDADVGKVDGTYINQFASDVDSYFEQSKKELNGMDWSSARDKMQQGSVNGTAADLDSRAELISHYLKRYGNNLDEKTVSSIAGLVDNYRTGSKSISDQMEEYRNYFAQWDSEDAYKQYLRSEELAAMTPEQLYVEAEKARTAYEEYVASEEHAQTKQRLQQEYNAKHKWDGVINSLTGGSNVPSAESLKELRDSKAEELKSLAEYYQTMADQKADQKIMDADLAELESWSEEERNALVSYVAESSSQWYENLNPMKGNQITVDRALEAAKPLIEKYGFQRVKEIAESYTRSKNKKMTDEVKEAAAGAVKGKAGASALHSGLSVGANVVGAVTSPVDYMRELTSRTGRYKSLDPNNAGNVFNAYSGAVRGQVAADIAGENENFDLRDVAALGYQGIMSAADSLARAALGGGSKAISLGLAATGSFSQTVSDASQRGASPAQAIALGVVNGGLEVATEYLPLDEILKVAKGGPVPAKQMFKNIFKQAAIEVAEEEVSFLGSLAAEALILREKSGYNQQIAQAVANGASYEEARQQADWSVFWEAVETAISSSISGGVSAGAGSTVANARNLKDDGKKTKQTVGDPNAHVELADPTVDFERETWDLCDRLAKATGRNIKLYQNYGTSAGIDNGYYSEGTIYVNTESGDPVAQIISHELTHSVEFAEQYKELSRMVLQRIESLGGNLKQMRQDKAELYAKNGYPLNSQAEIDQEIVAEYVAQNLLTNEQQIMEVARQNRTLIEKIKSWIDNLLGALGNKNAAERAYLTNVQNLYAKALQQTQNVTKQSDAQNMPVAEQTAPAMQENADAPDDVEVDWGDPVSIRNYAQNLLATGQITDEDFNGLIDLADQIGDENSGRENFAGEKHSIGAGKKYSFAGVNARTANSQTLAEAKALEEQGAANETIRQQTGWFKGMDGKWRFEVDDSTSRINENISNYMTLGELLQDAEILKAYPNMEDVSVVFQSLPDGVNASYSPQFDSIDVSYKLKGDPEAIRAAVLHEVQHVIQQWEGFTKGTNVGSWERKIKAGFDSRRGTDIRKARETEQELRRVQQEEPEFYRDMMELNAMTPDSPRGEVDWDTLEQITEDPPEWQAFDARRDQLEETYGDMKVWDFMDLLYQQEKAAKNEGRSATELYWDTAGEIEARNVAGRRNLTAEERKNTPPMLGDENTVFAGETGISFSQDISEYPYNMQTVIQEYIDSVDEDILSFVDEVQNGQAWPGKKITVGSVGSRMADTISKLTGVANTEGNPIILNTGAIEHIINRHGERGQADRSMQNSRDIARINYVLQNFDSAELSDKKNYGYRNKDNTPSQNVIFSKKINGTYFVIEAVPDTGKTGIVSAFISKKGAPQVLDDNAPSPDVRNVPAPAPDAIVPNDESTVKREMSISSTVSRKNVAEDLRAILSRGGDAAELRRYISQLEQGGGNTERGSGNTERTGAQRIIQAAKRNGISVEEYLRWNWEQYDVDGQWNEDARAALEQERRGRRYSISDMDSRGKKLTEEQKEFFKDSKARTGDGRLMVLYHQTGNDFTVFDTRREGAGKRDNGTPFGIFLKSSDRDIGLKGQKQMPLYANITNPLQAWNREELVQKFCRISPEYERLVAEINGLDQVYHDKFERAKMELREYITAWRSKNKDASRTALYDDATFNELYDAEDRITDEWTEKASEMDARAKEAITEALLDAGYDGVFLFQDKGSFGRSTDAYIALNPEQVKNVDNLTPTSNLDIRYSISGTEEQTEKKTAEQIRSEMPIKVRNYLQGAQRKMLTGLQQHLGVNKFTNREDLKTIAEEIANTYLTEGTLDPEKMSLLFDKAYAGGIVKDAEFYEQYKEIKQHLRTTGITISEGDSHDIADFDDFRRRNFGVLRIVKEGGLPVDSAYHELNEMAPELFPERITHPADQLVRMAEVARSIQISEKNLDEYYGEDRENFRRDARHEFENAVADALGDLQQVKRYIDQADEPAEAAPTTPEEAAEYYKQLKDARRAYERAQAKNLLTPHDEMQVGRLLKGEIQPEHLDPEKDFVKGILAVYEGKKEYERLCKLLAEYKRTVRAGYRDRADQHLETANEWKDKKVGVAYSRETMERNIDDIVPDEDVAKDVKREYFEAVHVSEAEATRFKTQLRNRVRGMKLERKIEQGNLVSEAHAVQLLGEAEDNIRVLQNSKGRMKVRDGKTMEEWRAVIAELWEESPNLDREKIRGAVNEFRKIYDELFEKMNAVRIRNGYEPVNYRQGYFPHFQPGESDGILGAFGKAMNIDTQVVALPTTINGLTHTFKPGIQWFGNAQERLGFNTAYDAVEGFDKYIEGVASVIYQTENIQKLRALAGQIRYRTSDEGIRQQVDAIRAREGLSEEEKQVQINSIYEHGKYTLSNFVNELDEYTNLLANKKSKLDRTMEAMMGRKAYAVMKAWEARVGANMIAGNLSSALTNFIPLTQAGAQLDGNSLLKGIAATLRAYKEDDGIVGMSSFLTNRRGSDPLVQTWTQKASGFMGKPMELFDGFTADSIVRAAYYQNLKRGMSEDEAMHQADVFASHVMADRSKGAMPTLFESKNPIFKAFTQFQLEVNNQFSEVFKDLPRAHRKKGLAALTMVLLKYFLGAFLYNEVYEYFVGRRAALDPFGILNDTVGDLTGYELPNLVEWGVNTVQGEDTSFETERVGIGEAGTNLASTALGELPFSSGLTLLGIETDGGRIPASSAVPDLTAIWNAATTEGWGAKKRWKAIQKELDKLAYVIPPFGGNQAGKLIKGVKAFATGGSYSVDTDGNDILQYPVYKDAPGDAIGNAVRMGIFGKNALPEAQEWVESGFKSFNADQTETYQTLVEMGANDRAAYAVIQDLADTKQLKGTEKLKAQQATLAGAAMTEEEKAVLVGHILGKEMTTEKGNPTQYANFMTAVSRGLSVDDFMDMRTKGVDMEEYLELTDAGLNAGAAMKTVLEMRGLDEDEDADYWRLAVDASDNEAVQLSLLAGRMSDAAFQKLKMVVDLDVSPDMYVTYYETRSKYDADGNGAYTQAEIKAVIDAMGGSWTNEQKGVLWQMATGSTSTKNNPYSKSAGQKWLDTKAAAKE